MRSRKLNNPPTIAITYPYPLGMPNGGATHARELSIHLAKAGARVILMPVSSNVWSRFPRQNVEEQFLGLNVDKVLQKYSGEIVRIDQHPFHWKLDGLAVKKALKELLKQREIDIVLSFYHDGWLLPGLLKPLGIKFGYIAAWQSYESALKTKRTQLLSKLWNRKAVIVPHRKADIIFANSKHTREELVRFLKLDPDKIVITPLGVDPAFFEIQRNKPEQITRFIYFARFVPLKGYKDAIEAFARLSKKGVKNWSLRMVGQGNRERVKMLAAEHGISDQVEILGSVDQAGVRRELEQAHLAILPSHAESFGLSVAEAQAAGLPVVAYNAGSVPEVVEDNVTAWLAPLHDTKLLSECLENAIRDTDGTYQAGLAGRERIRQKFTWDKNANLILESIKNKF